MILFVSDLHLSAQTPELNALFLKFLGGRARAAEEPELVARLAADGVPLTVCPLSNLALKTVPDLVRHPLLSLLDAGVNVTINSDDPAYFGGYVADNYLAMRVAGMTDAQAVALAHNSVEASFAEPSRKAALHRAIDRAS